MFKIIWTRHLPRRLHSRLHFLEVRLETGLKTYVLCLHQVFSPNQLELSMHRFHGECASVDGEAKRFVLLAPQTKIALKI